MGKKKRNITRLKRIWFGVKSRCETPSQSHYNYYGGRGIKMCEEWHDYSVFENWSLTNGYADDLSLDRIDPNGDYCSCNCRWVTRLEQMNNTRANHFVEYQGKRKTIAEWARVLNVNKTTLYCRIKRMGVNDALYWSFNPKINKDGKPYVPKRRNGTKLPQPRVLDIREIRTGIGYSQRQVAEAIGVSVASVHSWEHKRCSPTNENALKLANLYGVSVDKIILDKEKENDR